MHLWYNNNSISITDNHITRMHRHPTTRDRDIDFPHTSFSTSCHSRSEAENRNIQFSNPLNIPYHPVGNNPFYP